MDILEGALEDNQREDEINDKELVEELSNCSVGINNNVKVTPEKIYSIAVAPTNSKIVAFAGDAVGNIGVYDSSISSFTMKYSRPHSQTVTHLEFGDNGGLLSVGYDSTVRIMDVETGVHRQIFATFGKEEVCERWKGEPGYGVDEGEGYRFQYGCWDNDKGGIWLTTSFGNLMHFDIRSGKVGVNVRASGKKINCCSQNKTKDKLIAVGGLDREVKIFDIRKLGKYKKGGKAMKSPEALATQDYGGSINSVFFSPGGDKLLTTSTADVITVVKDAHLASGDMGGGKCQYIKHNNKTGRYLATFMARWHPTLEVFTVGSMMQPRRIEMFGVDKKGKFGVRANLKGEGVSAVCSRNCFHPNMPWLIGGSSSGRVSVCNVDVAGD